MGGSSGPVAQTLLKASCMLDELKESKTLLFASLPACIAKFWKKSPKDYTIKSQQIRIFPSTAECVGFQPRFLIQFHSGSLL